MATSTENVNIITDADLTVPVNVEDKTAKEKVIEGLPSNEVSSSVDPDVSVENTDTFTRAKVELLGNLVHLR